MTRLSTFATMGMLAFFVTALAAPAFAEEAEVYGVQAGIASAHPGAFIPTGTDFACAGFDKEGRCWDGKEWHRLYPKGKRHYAQPTGERVACRVIMKVTHDCWDGTSWYHLPDGALYGVTAGVLSSTPGAFLVKPIP